MALPNSMRRFSPVVKVFAALYWCIFLIDAEDFYHLTPYHVPYLAVCAAGLFCYGWNLRKPPEALGKLDRFLTVGLSLLLSAAVLLANYKLFPFSEKLRTGMNGLLCLIGSYFLFHQIALAVRTYVRGLQDIPSFSYDRKWIFWGSFGCLAALYFLVFWCALYPGTMTYDSIEQIRQVLVGNYVSHNFFWHTQFMRLTIGLGLKLFGDLNAAAAVYSCCSLLIMSAIFAGVIYTVYEYTGRPALAVVSFLFYLLMPYHIVYSVTLWKDVFFGGVVTLFALGAFRTLKGLGKHPKANLVLTVLSAIGMCMLRSNGLLAMVACVVVFALFFFKTRKKLLLVMAGTLVAGYILAQPVPTLMGVVPADFVESLSIPIQQVARVVADGCPLTEEEQAMLDAVVDTEQIPEAYLLWLSDPMKMLVRAGHNTDALKTWPYLKLYIRLGLKYPGEYIRAWVDQTKGFWNGGYRYYRWYTEVLENDYGLALTVHVPQVRTLLDSYGDAFLNNPMLVLFCCIGFFTWLLLYCTYAACVRRDRAAIFTTVPFHMVILTLLVATPVASEFRYIYAVFCAMPLLLVISFCGKAAK